MTTLGVISDTHGLMREEAVELLKSVDHIIHAGDIGKPEIIASLERIAPLSAIRGNIDLDLAGKYPETLRLPFLVRRFTSSKKGTSLRFGRVNRALISLSPGILTVPASMPSEALSTSIPEVPARAASSQ